MIGSFNFKFLKENIVLITNDIGKYMLLSDEDFRLLLSEKVNKESELYKKLEENFFLVTESKIKYINQVAAKLREEKNYIFKATELHIFVVTNYCNSDCIYCQAKSSSIHTSKRMNFEIAEKAVRIALQSPANNLTFEFQGGEPLSNFDTIKHIIEFTEEHMGAKKIAFNIVSNLALLTNRMIDYLEEHNVSISTSLDGDHDLHCKNRPLHSQQDSFVVLNDKVRWLQEKGASVGAIQTTTKYSLCKYKEIIDTYLEMGLQEIFLRPLTPLGFALDDWEKIGYTPEDFLKFYNNSMDYILELNLKNICIKEGHAKIFLNKIINGQSMNYMELRSPCGASIGQITYYYDGRIFTCDEGRMLAEMGDDTFYIGNVIEDNYDTIIDSKACRTVCKYSILESLPKCFECPYQPYCGTCPVINYALEKDIVTKKYSNYRCRIYEGMIDKIFSLLSEDKYKEILEGWVKW